MPLGRPVYYFFYGMLTAAANLKRIDLQPAGGAQTSEGSINRLCARKCEEEVRKLAYYETNAYRVAYCWVFFTDDEEPSKAAGKTFKYAGDAKSPARTTIRSQTLDFADRWETGVMQWSNHS
ncbi:hypothetical protein Egran_05329 [Elaphomyces granulatus]|uniref:Gamma-glutamylcyclotransferase AIG2-like domain-containing protein n=1 Tax=Elaphomyces granulatus TaxID=519963 RepID=A0A232LS41_9EURO|nr:hypothetical protein Egran_05329 [Elaphomyces granulatus]